MLDDMNLTSPKLLKGLVKSDFQTDEDAVTFLQSYGITRGQYEEALSISHRSRLEGSITSSVWEKIRHDEAIRNSVPKWLKEVFETPFDEVARSVNGLGDFKKRDYNIFSESELITEEMLSCFNKFNSELLDLGKSTDSTKALVWYELGANIYSSHLNQTLLHVAIQQTVRKPGSSSFNWFFTEVTLPDENILFWRCNADMTSFHPDQASSEHS